jgi:hypothetical protein
MLFVFHLFGEYGKDIFAVSIHVHSFHPWGLHHPRSDVITSSPASTTHIPAPSPSIC